MKIKITEPCFHSGGEPAEIGEVLELPKKEADAIIGAGRAVEHIEPPAAPQPPPPPADDPPADPPAPPVPTTPGKKK